MNHCIYAVGDIHGRLDLLLKLQEKILEDSQKYQSKTIVYLGDYIDRGPDSKQVIDHLINNPLPGIYEVFLKGNHEQMVTNIINDKNPDVGEMISWLTFGGANTLASYDMNYSLLFDKFQDVVMDHHGFAKLEFKHRIKNNLPRLLAALPKKHVKFYNSLKLYHRESGYFFVHAGIHPKASLDQQDEGTFLWIRKGFVDHIGDYSSYGIKKVVHGHTMTASGEVEILNNRIGVDTGAHHNGVLSCIALSNVDGTTDEYPIDSMD